MNSDDAAWGELLSRLDKILVYRKGNQRAPHKPLYLLYLISNLQKGLPRLQQFEVICDTIKESLLYFGLKTKTYHPEYPFWRLQNDDLAIVEVDGQIDFRKSNDDPKKSSLIRNNARGGLLEADYALLSNNSNLQSIAVHKILDAHFPQSIHDDIVRYFDLILQGPHAGDNVTEKIFRKSVLSAYGNKCALTGYSLNYKSEYVGIEAAHICWHQAGGNDDVCNGIAMSSLHRKLYHLGLFTINDKYTAMVSSVILDNSESILSLKKMQGRTILLPENRSFWPNKRNLLWHMRWVYRG